MDSVAKIVNGQNDEKAEISLENRWLFLGILFAKKECLKFIINKNSFHHSKQVSLSPKSGK
ncbi:MAG: hypothetical protein DBX44_05135 [Oscillospiraceae bacterium]|nr:MAG: hypothetical protein DBX44_05135 [Oscillospiraceae bacterium]